MAQLGEPDTALWKKQGYGDAPPHHATPWRGRPAILGFTGLVLAGVAAVAVYVGVSSVEETREIRCYYQADLTTEYPAPYAPHVTLPPYVLAGKVAKGAGPIDPVGQCADLWDNGVMNPGHITDDLIPPDFRGPATPPGPREVPDVESAPATVLPYDVGPGHFVPELTACVVDSEVAVLPGPAEVCDQLGIPTFE